MSAAALSTEPSAPLPDPPPAPSHQLPGCLRVSSTMEKLKEIARQSAVRSGGHFAVVGISEAGSPSMFSTHADGELASLWKDETLQQYLRSRHEEVPEEEWAGQRPADAAAYQLAGMGQLKKHMANCGVVTVGDLARADFDTIAAIIPKVQNTQSFRRAIIRAQEICGSPDANGVAVRRTSAPSVSAEVGGDASSEPAAAAPAEAAGSEDASVEHPPLGQPLVALAGGPPVSLPAPSSAGAAGPALDG